MSFFRVALFTLLIVVAGYGLKEAWPLLSGPQLSLATPVNGTSTPTGFITVSGHVARVVALDLDGAPVLPDASGAFSKTLLLPPGGSILTVTAADRFGHKITDTRTVYVQ